MNAPTRARCTAIAGAALAILLAGAAAAQELPQREIMVSGGSGPGEVNVYVAEEGDNLWDIADRFFYDPWYWPVLWSFNPHITNPNWIFPGDLVYLVPPRPVVAKREGYSVTESRYSAGPQVEAALGRRVGFISPEEYEGSGVLSNSKEEKQFLSDTDEAYVRFETARRMKPGDLMLVYRVEEEVEHPVTDEEIGYKIRYLGVIKITSTEKPLAKAVLLVSFQEVERGDRVAAFAPLQRLVPPVRNSAAVAGHVVTTFDDVAMLGEYHYVVIDRGTKDGVAAGNRFVVRDRGDGLDDYNPKPKKRGDFPLETYGEFLIIDASEATSLAIVTYANREIAVGVPCDMLAGY
ncbi:MAG: LysM peptidoglycan-binding domain-containing protein [Deltaproteobacteria bacterium]|nr:LysM peptidoglycan-binding domain-containing protein [Deltaproteobacteria bacterium]